MPEIDHCPTNVGETPYDPFAPAKRNSKIVNPETGHSITYGNKGEITEQALAPNFWTRRTPASPEPARIKPRQPRAADELAEAIEAQAQALTEELSWYDANKGTNPNQERIVRLKLEIARLQEKLNPLLAELAEAQAEPTPSDRIVKRLADITVSIQGLAREATERKIIQLAKDKYDVSDLKALDRQTVKNLQASDTLRSIKDLTLPFWSRFAKLPRLDDLQEAADRVFAGTKQLLNFLK
jgi:hypothetical protein